MFSTHGELHLWAATIWWKQSCWGGNQEDPLKRPVTRRFDICYLVNNREAGDLRRHRASYDVIVMSREPVVTYVSDKLHWLPAHNYIYLHFLDGLISTWLHGWTLSSMILDLCNMDFMKWFDNIPIKRLLGKESYGIDRNTILNRLQEFLMTSSFATSDENMTSYQGFPRVRIDPFTREINWLG